MIDPGISEDRGLLLLRLGYVSGPAQALVESFLRREGLLQA